jgi:hypothetical protein
MAKAPKWREAVISLVSERFGGENCELPEERLGEGFPLFVWKFQVLVGFGFHVVKFFGGSELREPQEEQLVGVFSFHDFEAIEYLAMRDAFPDGENHGFAVDGIRNGQAFVLPPHFLGLEHIAVGDILKPAAQKVQR